MSSDDTRAAKLPLLQVSDTVLEVSEDVSLEGRQQRKGLRRNQPGGLSSKRSFRSEDGQKGKLADEGGRCESMEHGSAPATPVSGMHQAIQGAVQEAVQEHLEGVHEAVQDAVTEAVQAAVDEGMSFDVRANLYTLIAITGVVLYWRGIWTTWDYFFGFSLQSELGAVATGLGIMVVFRLLRVPLLAGLPSG